MLTEEEAKWHDLITAKMPTLEKLVAASVHEKMESDNPKMKTIAFNLAAMHEIIAEYNRLVTKLLEAHDGLPH